MIGSLANAQNQAQRKLLEVQGYKFSLGSDGWCVYFDDDIIEQATSRRRGEGTYEDNLDRAVFAANAHKNQREKEASVAKPKEDLPLPEKAPAEPKKLTLQSKAVRTAVQFLTQAGAQYRVEFDGEVFTNMPEPKAAAPKMDFASHWQPILKPLEGTGAFTVVLDPPKDMDLSRYATAIRAYLFKKYGPGNALTEIDKAAHTMTIMVASGD